MKFILLISVIMGVVISVCPNGCSGHGRCVSGVCVCFDSAGIGDGKSYGGNDCSLLKCPEGNPLFASSSPYPESSGSDFGIFVRELYSSDKSRSLEQSTMTLDSEGAIDGAESGKLWKVSTEDDFFNPLPKTGGVIQCSYADSDGNSKNEKVEVVGVSDDKRTAYLQFGEKIKADQDPFTCSEIVSIRKSMVYYGASHSIDEIVSRQLTTGKKGAITWSNYGVIFKDLGILNEVPAASEGDPVTYSNNKFKFVCYTSTNELTVYSATATNEGVNDNNVKFTLSGTPDLDTDNSYCYCLMDANAKETEIEKTELMEIVKKEDKKYFIGKFLATTDPVEKDENGYAVITLPSMMIVGDSNTATVTLTSKSDFIIDNRVAYVDLLKDNKIVEKEVILNKRARMVRQLDPQSVTIESNVDDDALDENDIVLPYVKMHSSNPTKDTPPVIDNSVTLATYLYKVYSLAAGFISQLNINVGGKLQCSYNDGDEKPIVADVKGYKLSSTNNHVLYSYIQFPVDISSNIKTVKCSKIILKRKDFTLYNPLELTDSTGGGNGNYDDTTFTLTWDGYSTILSGITLTADNLKFACYKNEGEKEITVYSKVGITSAGVFTIAKSEDESDKHPANGDICYLVAKSDGKESLELLDSDLSEFIRYEEGEDGTKTYYYGKYTKPTNDNPVIVEPGEDGSPVFILKEGAVTDKQTITLKTDTLNDDDLKFFEVGQTIYIEVVGDVDKIPYNHKAKIIKELSSKQRLLTVGDKTIYYTPPPPAGTTPTGVILTSIPVPLISSSVIDPDNNLYNVKDFYDDLISQLPPKFGGILQCKYVKTTGVKTEESMGFVDVKGYKINEADVNEYLQFDREVSTTESDGVYYIQKVVCNKIISTRNDLSLYNPTTAKADDSITWTGYGKILSDIKLTFEDKMKFACYNSEDKMIIEYTTSVIPTTDPDNNPDVTFTFVDGPSENDICYLLADASGNEINIESSELFEFVRKEDDGNYYYGKYEDVVEGESKIIVNDDGSQTIVLGSGSFITTVEESGVTDAENKINIAKLNNENSPSIAYPPSLISDGIKKLMIPGTIIKFVINGGIQKSQIIKIGMSDKTNKLEILLSNPVSYVERIRLLNYNIRELSPTPLNSLIMTFTNEESVHKPLECSGQGICDRSSGICKCYDGYSGSACQRLDCPNDCNGNGRCVAISELLNDEGLIDYKGYGNERTINDADSNVVFEDQIFGCLCDKRHRGYDCSLIECPSGIDPEKATNDAGLEYRDCSGRGICNYESGICECFDGFSGEGCQTQIETM